MWSFNSQGDPRRRRTPTLSWLGTEPGLGPTDPPPALRPLPRQQGAPRQRMASHSAIITAGVGTGQLDWWGPGGEK